MKMSRCETCKVLEGIIHKQLKIIAIVGSKEISYSKEETNADQKLQVLKMEEKGKEKEYDYKTKSWYCKKCKLENCDCKD